MHYVLATVCTFSYLVAIGAAQAGPQAAPKPKLAETSYRFDSVVRGAVVSHDFVLENVGTAVLHLRDVRAAEPLAITGAPVDVAPGGKATIRATLDTAKTKPGVYDGVFYLSYSEPGVYEAMLSMSGRVVPNVEVKPRSVLTLTAMPGEDKRAELEIVSNEPEPLRILNVEQKPLDAYTAKLEPVEEGRRYKLSIALKPDGRAGKRQGLITLTTSSAITPTLKITTYTYLKERVHTFPDSVDMGGLPIDQVEKNGEMLQTLSQTLMIYQEGGKDFQVKASTDIPYLDVKAARGPTGDRWEMTLTLVKSKLAVGPIRGSVVLETNDPQYPKVVVPVTGEIVGRAPAGK